MPKQLTATHSSTTRLLQLGAPGGAAAGARFADLDLENVAEELESLGKEQAHKLNWRCACSDLLEWRYQPQRRSRSWRGTVVRERTNAGAGRQSGPEAAAGALFATAYRGARRSAETGLPLATFPETAPFSLAQALDDGSCRRPDRAPCSPLPRPPPWATCRNAL